MREIAKYNGTDRFLPDEPADSTANVLFDNMAYAIRQGRSDDAERTLRKLMNYAEHGVDALY